MRDLELRAVRKKKKRFKRRFLKAIQFQKSQKVCDLPEDEYVDFLANQAAKAAVYGQEELVFNEQDRARVGKKVAKAANALLAERGLPGQLTVSELTRDICGGVLVKMGDIEANCSVEAIAGTLRSEMASEVAGALF